MGRRKMHFDKSGDRIGHTNKDGIHYDRGGDRIGHDEDY